MVKNVRGDGHFSTPGSPRPCRWVASDGEDVGDQTTNADVSLSDFIGLCIKPLYEVSKKQDEKTLPSQRILFKRKH